jgi:hypothetical protein
VLHHNLLNVYEAPSASSHLNCISSFHFSPDYINLYTMYYHFIYLYCRTLVQSMSYVGDWIIQEGQNDHLLGGCTTWLPDFTINQLVGAFSAHSCSVFALLPTSCLDCSVLADQSFRPIGWTAQCSSTSCFDQLVGLLGARQPVVLTSWLDCSVLANQSFRPAGWTARCSPTNHSDQLLGLLRQLH